MWTLSCRAFVGYGRETFVTRYCWSPSSSSFMTTPSKVEQHGVAALIGTPTGSVQSFFQLISMFQRNAWILLHVHVLAPWVLLLALNDRGYILWHVSKTLTMTRWVLEFWRGLPSMWSGRLQWRSVECYLQDLLDRISAASYVRTFDDRVVFWRHCENGWLSGPLYVCDWGATFRAMHYVVILI